MNVGVFRGVVVRQSVDDSTRLLRGCGVVQIDEWLAMDLQTQNGKVLANLEDLVVCQFGSRFDQRISVGGSIHPTSSQCLSASSPDCCDFPSGSHCRMIFPRYSRTESDFMRSSDSLAKAKSSRRRAEISSMPRVRI